MTSIYIILKFDCHIVCLITTCPGKGWLVTADLASLPTSVLLAYMTVVAIVTVAAMAAGIHT